MIWSLVILFSLSFCFCKDISYVTNSDFQSVTKQNKCMFFYVETENCEDCKMIFHKFVTAAQTFQNVDEIYFGRVSDESLIEMFEVDSFPEIVYYEYESDIPRRYRGDITTDAIISVVIYAMRGGGDLSYVKRQHALELTINNFREFLYNSEQYRLVMLHEEDDWDEIDAFEELAKTYDNEKELVVARINVDKQNSLRREFKSFSYPCFYWFEKGTDVKRKGYEGDMNLDGMIKFINNAAGFQRLSGGELESTAGLIDAMDDLLKANIENIYEVRNLDKLIKKMKKIAAKLKNNDKEAADYYIQCVEEIQEEKTVDSLGEESKMLSRMLDEENLGPLRKDSITKQKNIVSTLIGMIGEHLFGAAGRHLDASPVRNKQTVKDIQFREEL